MPPQQDEAIEPSAIPDADLAAWYLNLPRIAQLVGTSTLASFASSFQSITDVPALDLQRISAESLFKDAIVSWLRTNQPASYQQLLLSDNLAPGVFFTAYTAFSCSGLSALAKKAPAIPPDAFALLRAKIPLEDKRSTLEIKYHPKHLCSATAWSKLSGKARLFVFAYVDELKDHAASARPYVIADPIPKSRELFGPPLWHWQSYCETTIDQIDNFSEVKAIPPPKEEDLEILKSIPEDDIKRFFADIIGEPHVPRDWGGERSDLFTTYLTIAGKRLSSAFAFKGPSRFAPMTLAALGVNGDQLERLYTEPADLLVLQHCHRITNPVRTMMRAFACQVGKPRLFCLVDGFDTLRLLKAYGKAGL